MGKSLTHLKKQRRYHILQQQEQTFPGFWDVLNRTLPQLSDNKRLVIADLIESYFINPKHSTLQSVTIEQKPIIAETPALSECEGNPAGRNSHPIAHTLK